MIDFKLSTICTQNILNFLFIFIIFVCARYIFFGIIPQKQKSVKMKKIVILAFCILSLYGDVVDSFKEALNQNLMKNYKESNAILADIMPKLNASKHKEQQLIARGYYIYGNNYYSMNEYLKAIDFFKKAIEAQSTIDQKNAFMGSLYAFVGFSHHKLGEYDKAKEALLKAQEIQESIKDPKESYNIKIYITLGDIFSYYTEYAKAGDYYNKALAILQKSSQKDDELIQKLQDRVNTINKQ